MSDLAARLRDALAGSALAKRLPEVAATFIERRRDVLDGLDLDDAAVRGLARLLASQPDVGNFLSHRPEFVARLQGLSGGLPSRFADLADDESPILELDLEAALDAIRLRRREEMGYAACADLSGVSSFEEVSDFLSELAETTTQIALALARREIAGGADGAEAFAVIGMGKLAGRELTYHSDLDLIFLFSGGPEHIARASRIGQRLISYLTMMTGAGHAYEVDARLRPSGGQGMLVTSFEAFERYQLDTAETWEHLAQLRGRAIAGAEAATEVLDRVHEHILSRKRSAWRELADLRERVRVERAPEAGDAIAIKTGSGGLMDVDFLAGGCLLERGTAHFPAHPSVPAMLRAGAAGPRVDALLDDYRLLRIVEARMRWVAGRGIETLTPDADARAVIAELVEPGLGTDAMLARLEAARARIRAAFDAVVESDSIEALED